ncbi:hypothetical protein [Sphingomonas astaxanthinifaciens]|uniref:Uncharacterized protein n=1 Tax=Sphingomonas astaxanthinifaciens DSM 22298 TaxID=1123267 RepID=A0ABQ5Z9L3_9SPHN|nr:hypothetical protein [Sphingomonas astaxanthinifaciens]GLR48690.1 hypothetical protein GCM10007925_24090 [Sphingomonas astaxanthinifaciens DSM 22298]
MKKALLLAAASMLITTAANAAPVGGTLTDNDHSANKVSYSGSSPDNFFEDADDNLTAKFTLRGEVTKTCAIQGVDEGSVGLSGTIDLGTIGISAGDDQAVGTLFMMTGPGTVQINSAAAGCNYTNQLSLSKDDIRGLVNNSGISYDSNQFQANIPYNAEASFTGVSSSAGAVAGTPQSVVVGYNANAASGNFGAWRSPLSIQVGVQQVTGKALIGGTYQGVLTLNLAII